MQVHQPMEAKVYGSTQFTELLADFSMNKIFTQ